MLNQLPPEARKELHRYARLSQLDNGDMLLGADHRDELLYLLRGKVALLGGGITLESVEAGSPRSRQPLIPDAGDVSAIKALGPASVARFSKTVIEKLRQQGLDAQPDAQSSVLQELQQACESGTLEVPIIPEVATRVRQLALEDEASLAELAQLLQTDAAIAARIIEVANSAFYRGTREARSVPQAVNRLGFRTACNLAISMNMRNLYEAATSQFRKRMREIWQESVQISAASYLIANRCTPLDPDRALLAGLIHNIGAIPLVGYATVHFDDLSIDELNAALEHLAPTAGVLVMQAWGMDPELIAVVEHHGEWKRHHDGPTDLCDVVNLAALLTHEGEEDLPMLEATTAFQRIVNDNPRAADQLDELARASEEIRAVQAFLS